MRAEGANARWMEALIQLNAVGPAGAGAAVDSSSVSVSQTVIAVGMEQGWENLGVHWRCERAHSRGASERN